MGITGAQFEVRVVRDRARSGKAVCLPVSRWINAKAMAGLLAMAFYLFAAPASALQNGDVLTNVARLDYTGGGSGIESTVDVTVALPTTTDYPPTDISLACAASPGCTGQYVFENNPGAIIGAVSTVDPDQASGHSFVVTNDNRFEVVNGKLKLVDGVSVDYETEKSISVTIQATDNSGNTLLKTFTIAVRNVNEAPYDLAINNNYVPADAAGEKIGKLTVSDPDVGDTHTFSVLGDSRFIVSDGYLALAGDVSLAPDSDIPVTVLATDSGGLTARLVVMVTTNPANRDVTPTQSTIALLAPDTSGTTLPVAPAACQAPAGLAAPSPRALSRSYETTRVPGDVVVNSVDAYSIGDPVLIRVTDGDQNLQPTVRDTVEAIVDVTGTGDRETVTLTETGEDTGEFSGYIYTTSKESGAEDCVLSVASRSEVSVTYTDPEDARDTASASAAIEPLGIVFDDVTGNPVNGIILTLVRVDTGKPAEVRGDGPAFALYPSAVKSGATVYDQDGLAYDAGDGEFRFPAIPAGDYRLEVFNKTGWEISTRPDAELQSLSAGAARASDAASGNRFSLSDASRGGVFHVTQGALPRIDIPLHKLEPKANETPTKSSVQFMQYSNLPNVGTPVNVQQTECVGGQQSQVSELQDQTVPVPGIVNLVPTDSIKAGQPVFVRVTDPDQNQDPTVRETITIELDVPMTHDTEYLALTETEPNSGQFIGYIQSGEGGDDVGNCSLGVVKNSVIRTTYTDAFNNTDTSESSVLVDPYGVVFSSFDGTPVDGITITLVNADTGQPAEVKGDGPSFADFPSTVVTGGVVTDAAGNNYDFPKGEYRFPLVKPGHYRLELSNVPNDYAFPSVAEETDIQKLPGAPFEINAGSRGEDFEVPLGPALHIDIPLDRRNGEVYVTKRASKQSAAIGDFVQYNVNVENRSSHTLSRSKLQDRLPKGFRYRSASLRINGASAGDPAIGPDGRTFTVNLPPVGTDTIAISYVTEITAGATKGKAVNEATVVGGLVASSNVARATVTVSDDLFRDKAILTGRVTVSPCDDKAGSDGDTSPQGLAGVRIFLEDGTNVVTDQNGEWHIEGIKPGTHVVQLDKDSLPERYEPSTCNRNSRFAGTPFSQFVDVQGGTLWRADFSVQQKPAPESKIKVSQSVRIDGGRLKVTIDANNEGPVDVNDVDVLYNVPNGWKIEKGSETLDGQAASHSQTIVGSRWRLQDLVTSHELAFNLVPIIQAEQQKPRNKVFVMRPRFGTRIAALNDRDKAALDRLAAVWSRDHWDAVTIVGHTDSVPIAPRNRGQFKDNEALSRARAQAVADYLKGKLDIPVVHVVGVGDRYPIAANDSSTGRRQNRRVEFLLKAGAQTLPTQVTPEMLQGESIVRLAYKSLGSPKGHTDTNRLPLSQLAGGFDVITTTASGKAQGSWDLTPSESKDVAKRDPNVQGLINITDGTRLSRPISSVKLDLDSRLAPKLTLDGKVIGSDRIGFKMHDDDSGKTLYSYIGVDFGAPGVHTLELQGLDGFGNARFEDVAKVVRVGDLYNIKVISTDGNVADGKSPVQVKLALTDRAGERIEVPYKLELDSSELHRYDMKMSLSDLSQIQDANYVDVDSHGVLRFNPVSHSGTYHAKLKYQRPDLEGKGQEIERDVQIYVKPEQRDWIMVGLAEGTAAYRTLSGNMQGLKEAGIKSEVDTEGRVAFYAKGQVKGQYILTAAYDSTKTTNGSLNQQIDPNRYYTLYGDKTSAQYDAPSQRKLYLKLEKNQFYALFGDYTTGLTVTRLSNYSRSFNGLKTEYEGKKVKFNAFASEADQAFVKDEIRGDGTSGLYHLSSGDVVVNSEQVTIQTRDRFHSEDILENKQLQRYVDYDIDYDAGTIFFKAPVYSQDATFNPVYIVVDYETAGDGRKRLNGGGRIALKLKDDSEAGITLIHEGVAQRESNLAGADLHYQVDSNTDVRAEVAATRSNKDGTQSNGSAYLAEVTHRTNKVDTRAYVRQQQGKFGLGQQNASESGTRKLGAEGSYHVSDAVELRGEAYRQTTLGSGATEDVASTSVQYRSDNYSVNTGLRSAVSQASTGKRVSSQVTAGGDYRLLDGKAKLSANADTPIGGQNGAANFPRRLRVGLDYQLSNNVTLKAVQEFTWGDKQNTQGTRVGMTSRLWKGAQLDTQVEQTQEENGKRLAAVTGLKQHWEYSDNWRFDVGVDRSKTLNDRSAPPLQVTTVYSSPGSTDFTSVTFGSNFRKDAWDWSTRVEYKTAATENKVNLLSDVIRDLDEGKQLLAKVNIQRTSASDSNKMTTDIQLGYSYRPAESRWTLFNRLDLTNDSSQDAQFDVLTQKVINNLNANYRINATTQVALQYGVKYVVDNFDHAEYRGMTDLYGLEVRHDLNEQWDLGVQSSLYNSWGSGTSDHSYGMSVGYSFAQNVWMSVGYNFSGFHDEDFAQSDYTAKGVYLKYRFKFDQNSLGR